MICYSVYGGGDYGVPSSVVARLSSESEANLVAAYYMGYYVKKETIEIYDTFQEWKSIHVPNHPQLTEEI